MDRDQVFAGVKRVIEEYAGVEPHKIVEDAKLEDDLGFDSLDKVEMVMACEDEFRCELEDDDKVKALGTVRETVDYVLENVA